LRGKQEALFEGADMEDFNDGDASDTEEVGGVGGEEAGLDDADDLEDEGGGGASDSDIETCIKKIVLIFKEAEFEIRIAWAVLDLLDAAKADSVNGDLQAKEDGEGDKISGIHGTPRVKLDCRGWGGMGETQSIFCIGARVEKGGFEEGTKEEGEEGGLGKAWSRTPRAWAGGCKTWKELPEGGDKKPGT
jgi:hypothetical protein